MKTTITLALLAQLALLLTAVAAQAQPLTGKDRRDLADSTSYACYKEQRAGAMNKTLSDTMLKIYCYCFARKLAGVLTVQDMQAIVRAGQVSGSAAVDQEIRRRFDVVGAAAQCVPK